MAAKKKAEVEVEASVGFQIPPIDVRYFSVEIIGDSPLIVHAWSEKAKKEMLNKQMKKATKGKDAKDPWEDFCNALYWLSPKPEKPTPEDIKNGEFGFPSIAVKACAIDGAYQQGVIPKKTTARGAFHIDDEFIKIEGIPEMREDMVQIGGMSKVADIRYRPEFKNWRAKFMVKYNAAAISPEQILSMLNFGGFAVGLGEWRPSRDGNFGRFHVREGNE